MKLIFVNQKYQQRCKRLKKKLFQFLLIHVFGYHGRFFHYCYDNCVKQGAFIHVVLFLKIYMSIKLLKFPFCNNLSPMITNLFMLVFTAMALTSAIKCTL